MHGHERGRANGVCLPLWGHDQVADAHGVHHHHHWLLMLMLLVVGWLLSHGQGWLRSSCSGSCCLSLLLRGGLLQGEGPVVEAAQLLEGLGQRPWVADHAVGGVVAVGKVSQHALAGLAPGELAVPAATHVDPVAVADVQHEELGALADLGVLGRGVGAGAGPRVAHEHQEFGRLFRGQQTLAVEGMHVALELLLVQLAGVATPFVVSSRTTPTTDVILLTLGIVVFAIVTTVLHPFAVQCDDIRIQFNGVIAETDVDARNLQLLALGTLVAVHGPPRVLVHVYLVVLGAQGTGVVGWTGLAGVGHDEIEASSSSGRHVLDLSPTPTPTPGDVTPDTAGTKVKTVATIAGVDVAMVVMHGRRGRTTPHHAPEHRRGGRRRRGCDGDRWLAGHRSER